MVKPTEPLAQEYAPPAGKITMSITVTIGEAHEIIKGLHRIARDHESSKRTNKAYCADKTIRLAERIKESARVRGMIGHSS